MARIRSIKPEFWEDEEVGLLSRDARLLYIATWNMADDEGLLRWSAAYLKAGAFIYDDDINTAQVEALMAELVEAGFVVPYRGGKSQLALGWIPKFHKHQKPNRPQPSKLPAPSLQNPAIRRAYGARDAWRCGECGDDIPQVVAGNVYDGGEDPRNGLSIDHITPRCDGGSDYPSNLRATHSRCNSSKGSRNDSVNDAEQPPTLLPEPVTPGGVKEGRVGEGRGTSCAVPARKADPLWDAVMAECSVNVSELTPDTRGKHNKAVAMLRGAKADPAEVPVRASVWRSTYPNARLTTTALANHWPELDPALQRNGNGGLRSEPALRRALARGGPRDP